MIGASYEDSKNNIHLRMHTRFQTLMRHSGQKLGHQQNTIIMECLRQLRVTFLHVVII